MFISLKDLNVRKVSADQIINRLRAKLSHIPGATLYLQSPQDVRIGGRASNAQWQYTLQGDDLKELLAWAPRVFNKLKTLPGLADVNTDQQVNGLEAMVTIDRDAASRLGINPKQIDQVLADAFGQSQVSIMYTQLNQYHVVMEVAPSFWQSSARPGLHQPDRRRRQAGAAQPDREIHPGYDFAVRQPPGPISRGHDFLQSPAGRLARRLRRRGDQ